MQTKAPRVMNLTRPRIDTNLSNACFAESGHGRPVTGRPCAEHPQPTPGEVHGRHLLSTFAMHCKQTCRFR